MISAPLIRVATPDDTPALVALNADTQRHHIAAEPAVYRAPDPEAVAAWMRETLATHEVLIAEREGRPLGYAVFMEVNRSATAFAHARRFLLVDQLGASERRRGVGRALLEAIHALAGERGIAEILLDVRAANESAIAFYRALGYDPVQVRMRRAMG